MRANGKSAACAFFVRVVLCDNVHGMLRRRSRRTVTIAFHILYDVRLFITGRTGGVRACTRGKL